MYSVVSSYTGPGVYCYLQVVTRPQLTPATCSNPVPVVCRLPPPPVLFYNLFASKFTLNIMLDSGLTFTRAVQSQPFNIMHATNPEHLNLHFIIWDILLDNKLMY